MNGTKTVIRKGQTFMDYIHDIYGCFPVGVYSQRAPGRAVHRKASDSSRDSVGMDCVYSSIHEVVVRKGEDER